MLKCCENQSSNISGQDDVEIHKHCCDSPIKAECLVCGFEESRENLVVKSLKDTERRQAFQPTLSMPAICRVEISVQKLQHNFPLLTSVDIADAGTWQY